MSGTNNPPVLTADTASVTEDQTLVTTGNVLTNDTDPNGLTLSVTAVNGVMVSGTTTIVGSYGTLVIQPNGQYTYTLADSQANVRGLANGQVAPDTFTYTVSDGQSYTRTTSQTVTNLIPQSEAFNVAPWVSFSSGTAPVITANVAAGPNGGASTADEVTLTSAGSGLYFQTNVSGTYTFSVWVKLISGNGAFALNYYSGSANTSHTEDLVATTTWQQVSLTFTGDGNTFSNVALIHDLTQSTSGSFEFWGAELNPGSTIEPYAPTTGSAVTTTVTVTTPVISSSTLTVDVTGNTPVVNPDTASVAEGGTLVAAGNVLGNDTDGAGKTLTVAAVNGIAVSATATTTIVGTYGTLVIQANGQYSYTLASNQANVVALTSGQVVPDAFNYTVSDGQTYNQTTTQTVQNLITQSEAFNTSPWVSFSAGAAPVITANVAAGPNGGASTADQVAMTRANSGLYYQTNVSGTYTFSVWVKLVSGSGSFSLNYYSGAANSSDLETVVATTTWQRVSLAFTGDGNTFSNVALMLAPGQSAAGTFEFWGAQLNPGSTAEPYVATTGSSVTTTVTTTTPLTIGSTLTVDVTGHTTPPPVATPDTAAVTEVRALVATGNILTNDTDPAGLPLTVIAVNGTTVSAAGTTTIVGTYGTLVVQANGQYTYTLAGSQANVLALATGQVVPDVFSYTISDGNTYTQTTTQTAQNLITQSEAFNGSPWVAFSSGSAPVITANVAAGPNGGVSTADQVALASADSGLYYVANVSGTYTFSVWVKLVSGSGSFSLNYYSGSANSSDLETVVATTTWQRVSLTFTGDGNANSNLALMFGPSQTTAGTFQFWGAQLNSGSTVEPYVPTTGSAVTSTTVTTTTPLVVGSALTVDVTGQSSDPVASPDTAGVTESTALVATGNVLSNDTDPLGKTLSVVAVNGTTVSATGTTTIVGTYGTLVIQANGQYTYTLASNQTNVLNLATGQVVPDLFNYTISDGTTYTQTTTQNSQNLISQSEAFNGSPWVAFSLGSAPVITANVAAGPNGGASTADQVALASADSGLYYVTNVSGTYTFSVWVKLVSGSGNFSLNYYSGSANSSDLETVVATTTWQRVTLTFTGDGNANSNLALMLGPSQTTAGTFEFWGAQLNSGSTADAYVQTTGSAVTSTTVTTTTPLVIGSTLTVDVTGLNSNPVANPDIAAVTEDETLVATGNVLSNDTDPLGKTLTVVAVNGITVTATGTATIAGTYGTLAIQANGQYTYTLGNSQAAVRALANGQVAPDAFSYTVSDGNTYTVTKTQAAQNLITQSENFTAAPWVTMMPAGLPSTSVVLPSTLVITGNVDAGPMGGAATADQLNLIGPSAALYYQTTVTGQNTFSIWVRLVSGNGTFSLGYDSASTGTIAYQTVLATSAWQRISITFTGDGNASSWIGLLHSPYQEGDGVLEIWGAQLNAGGAPEPYVATTGTAVTTTLTTTTPLGSTLTVNVTGDTPVAAPDTAAVTAGGTTVATGNLLANDQDPAGQTLTIASVNGIAVSGATTITGAYGTLVVAANGTYTYTLAGAQTNVTQLLSGQTVADSFSYTLTDGLTYTNVTPAISQNLITQSEAFNTAPWVSFGSGVSIAANVAAGPNGGASTADQVTLNSANTGIYYQTNVPGPYTFSVWVKLVSGSGNFSFNYYDASIAASYLQSAVATSNWQRFTFSFTGDGDASSNVALMLASGQTASSFDFWGAELNPGTTADTYLPTSGAPATVTTPVTTTVAIGSTLTVAVSGNSTNQPGATLNLQNTTQAVVANLATDQWATALNVLPLGDSLTVGWTTQNDLTQNTLEDGYRGPLWSDFVDNNTLINFVGDQNDGPATLPDTADAGYGGLTTNQIAARLPGLLVSQNPNAILLMAGTNDIMGGVSASTIAANILSMLNTVHSFNPAIHVYVATLTPMVNSLSGSVAPVNTAITNMVAQARSSGLNASLVSMSNVPTSDISTDGVHPTATGYALMAQNFYSAILAQQPINGGTPGGPSNSISSSIFNLVGGSGDDVLIGNSGPNLIYGGSGNDVLEGGGGNDTLVGGSGADQFFITPTAGTVTIQDFNPTNDWLVWEKIPGLTSASQLTGSVVTQSGGATTINLASFGVNEKVVLANYTGSLSQSQFV